MGDGARAKPGFSLLRPAEGTITFSASHIPILAALVEILFGRDPARVRAGCFKTPMSVLVAVVSWGGYVGVLDRAN